MMVGSAKRTGLGRGQTLAMGGPASGTRSVVRCAATTKSPSRERSRWWGEARPAVPARQGSSAGGRDRTTRCAGWRDWRRAAPLRSWARRTSPQGSTLARAARPRLRAFLRRRPPGPEGCVRPGEAEERGERDERGEAQRWPMHLQAEPCHLRSPAARRPVAAAVAGALLQDEGEGTSVAAVGDAAAARAFGAKALAQRGGRPDSDRLPLPADPMCASRSPYSSPKKRRRTVSSAGRSGPLTM